MKIFYLIILSFVLLPGYSFAQEDICIGKKYKTYSDMLHEEREYQVYLPASYHKNETARKYPVIYLVDGELFFHSLTAVQKAFTGGRLSFMPECIIVGIISTDRTRDLTPTASAYGRDGTRRENGEEQGGGSDAFAGFLVGELRKVIDTTYRTSGENILFGHSYGGLFVINTFLKSTDQFDTFIALDPSLWWDNAKLAKEATTILQGRELSHKTLYVGVAGKVRPQNQSIHLEVMRLFLEETLPSCQQQGLTYYSHLFPDENHGTIPIPGMLDAFKQIYQTHKK